jgi:hypothetical protein
MRSSFDSFEQLKSEYRVVAAQIEEIWHRTTASRPPVPGGRSAEEQVPQAENADPVMSELAEVRLRLERTQIEVGVFGQSNRGKSTLLNALLGEEVSRMYDLPGETVVPVWVDGASTCANTGCPAEAHLVYADGHTECVTREDALNATGVQTRDPGAGESAAGEVVARRRNEEHGPVRTVIQHSSAPILRAGVRIVDSPGLSDPSCEELMEQLTLAELDRVSAALVVFLHLPGIGKEEIRLLESMGPRMVEKVFLICNVTDGLWENQTTRDTVIPWIREQIAKSEHCTLDPRDLNVYRVNARRAWAARVDDDQVAFDASGVPKLLEDVESFLAGGALRRLAEHCCYHLHAASAAVRQVLDNRLSFLVNPEELEQQRRSLIDQQRERERARDGVLEKIETSRLSLKQELGRAMRKPYEEVSAQISAMSAGDISQLNEQLKLRIEIATTRANQRFDEVIDRLETESRRVLREAFELEDDPEKVYSGVGPRPSQPSVPVADLAVRMFARPAAIAAAGAAVYAPIAGGAGIALIAAGPIGLVIGAVVGAVYALDWLSEAANPTPREIEELQNRLAAAASESEQRMHGLVDRALDYLASEVRRRFSAFSADASAELCAVRAFLDDRHQRDRHIAVARDLLAGLPAIGSGV